MDQKIKTQYQTLLFLFICLFTYSAEAQYCGGEPGALEVVNTITTGDSAKVIIINWENEMNAYGCVEVDSDLEITIYIRINLMTNDLESFPPLYLNPVLNGVSQFLPESGAVRSESLSEVVIRGETYFQAEFMLNYDASVYCTFHAQNPNPLAIGIELLTYNSNPHNSGAQNLESCISYPVTANIGTLFDPNLFEHSGPEYSNIFEGHKELCCPSLRSANSTGSSTKKGDSIIKSKDKESHITLRANPYSQKVIGDEITKDVPTKITFQPNPFSQEVNIAFSLEDVENDSNQELHIFNASGQLVFSKRLSQADYERQNMSISLQDMQNGVYWCVFGTNNPQKLVKMSN